MHRIAILLLSLMLILVTGGIVAPVYGQGGITDGTVTEVANAAERLGSVTVTLMAITFGTILLAIIGAWKLYLPSLAALQKANERADTMAKMLMDRIEAEDANSERADTVRLRMAEAQERMATMLDHHQQVEQENVRQFTAASLAARQEVFDLVAKRMADHEAFFDKNVTKPLNESLSNILTELRALKERIDDTPTKTQMEEVIGKLADIQGTAAVAAPQVEPELPADPAPAKTPSADGGKVGEVDAKGKE